jgi:hypothetical protein
MGFNRTTHHRPGFRARVADVAFLTYAFINDVHKGVHDMSGTWRLSLIFVLTSVFCATAFAAKPVKPAPEPAAPAPAVFAVKVDYRNGFVIVEGENLDAGTASATFAGVGLAADPASSDTELRFAFTSELSVAVDEMGNYVLTVTTDGGSFTLTAFVPLALTVPPEPPPPGPDCPCSTEWDAASTTPSPDGFAGLVPYCNEDGSDWVTVQFFDAPANNYWVMWTGWNAGTSSGYCELYLDGPSRSLSTQDQFDACADYLRNIVTVWGTQGNMCLF